MIVKKSDLEEIKAELESIKGSGEIWKEFVKVYLILRDAEGTAAMIGLGKPEFAEVYLEYPAVKKAIAEADYNLLTGKADVDFVKHTLKLQVLKGKNEGARLRALDQLVNLLNIKSQPEDREIKVIFEDKKRKKKNAH